MSRTRVRWDRVAGVILGVALSVTVLAGRGLAHGGPASAQPRTRAVAVRVHEVRAGETLWGIARQMVGSGGDPRPVVDSLVAANHLRDARIVPGQLLVLPAAA